jgi:pimeloyl-ACP methyl ester carboxylesterase
MTLRRSLLAAVLLAFAAAAVPAWADAPPPRWLTLPPTPTLPKAEQSGYAPVNGIKLWYAEFGKGSPVVLLHGGLANSNYWGLLVPELARNHRVIVVDSRGHGRSTRDTRPYGYDLMADDVVALLDYLKIEKAAVVGWSDGGILGIDLALRHPARVSSVFAFAANTDTSGVVDGVEKNPTFAAYIERAGHEYEKLSATPKEYDAFVDQISKMWATQPNWTAEQLKAIKTPVVVVDGDHDEAIKRPHTEQIAAQIPGAGLLILPNTSHFSFLQDPAQFAWNVEHFLDQTEGHH